MGGCFITEPPKCCDKSLTCSHFRAESNKSGKGDAEGSRFQIRVELDETKVKDSSDRGWRSSTSRETNFSKMVGELPPRENRRGGVGWWMDEEGRWRAPADWPGQDAPVDGWTRSDDGTWRPPPVEDESRASAEKVVLEAAPPKPKKRDVPKADAAPKVSKLSKQGQSDVRAMLLVGSSIAVAVVIAIGLLLTQQGAEASSEGTDGAGPEVVFAAETEAVRAARRIEAALTAPDVALAALDELADLPTDAEPESAFDESLWEAQPTDCLDPSEIVFIERSATPIEFADNLECVPANGSWHDPYVDVDIERTIDGEVRSLIPLEIVHSSGGHEWTPATRELFANDVDHPATLVILSRGSGHNPRNQGPEEWRPSNETTWCGYAIDWVTVKQRWELGVTADERAALIEMLQTCSDPGSDGPLLSSMVIDPIALPVIERTGAE